MALGFFLLNTALLAIYLRVWVGNFLKVVPKGYVLMKF